MDEENFLVNDSKEVQPHQSLLARCFSLDDQRNKLQEAFFCRQPTDDCGMYNTHGNRDSPIESEESLKDANFDILKRDNVVETFRHISPPRKILDTSFATPVNHNSSIAEATAKVTGIPLESTLQLPKYNPSVNYFDMYWQMYLKNESLMNQVFFESEERD